MSPTGRAAFIMCGVARTMALNIFHLVLVLTCFFAKTEITANLVIGAISVLVVSDPSG